MEYTQKHEQMMFEMKLKEQDEEIYEEDILAYLDDKNVFMHFGDGLRRIIRKKIPEGYEGDECTYLKDMAMEQNISFNRNTLKGWFDGKAPKKGDKDRERMFLICFSLRLNIEETAELFQKVYCDRTFNLRNYKEFIYFCCINNGWTYEHAAGLIEQIEFSQESSDFTIYTQMMHGTAKELKCDQDIVKYVVENKHNFDIRNRTARRKLDELLGEVQGRKEEPERLKNGEINDQCSYIAQECFKNPMIWNEIKNWDDCMNLSFNEKDTKEKHTKTSFFSISTMVNIIYGIDMVRARTEMEHSLIKNSNLPQAVKGRFPLSQTFSKKEPTSEEYRKMIILLYSYKFWILKSYSGMDIGFDEYRDGLDDILYEAYLQKLYIGNPFDWLFMYCTISDDSLSLFRTLIGEGLLTE